MKQNGFQDGQATLWPGVLAFGKQADALAKQGKGDLVSVAGTMQINQWTGQDGDPFPDDIPY
ncbi:hypothetical protein DNU52_07485 [Salmonella enterica subsp. diarizonae]|nr:hypothetical protein LFZ92_04575 [Salmonella enterica subsp. salamae serovar 57:z29:z42]EAA2772459.1 hypothetical protein [Salmonella enterica subsp. diarizonae]EHA0597716.1 single-stranded DNA-binding protein [Salmonella enterica]HAU3265765.1 single-stranded DNA-binding protein [Salmonella enterica subsp. salamae]ECZ0255942.1 single-stranded DNA-binding protein [Salmonella enterica subsp. diarizonae]